MKFPKITFRKILLWMIIIALFVYVYYHREQLEVLYIVLRQGQWGWVAVALGLQLLYFYVYALQFRSAFTTVHVDAPIRDIVPTILASFVLNLVAPTGGASGGVLIVDAIRRRTNQPLARVAAGAILSTVSYSISFLPILLYGGIYLYLQHAVRAYEIIGALGLLVVLAVWLVLLLLAVVWPRGLLVALGAMQRAVNGFSRALFKRQLFMDHWATLHTDEFKEAATAIFQNPLGLLKTGVVAHVAHIVNLATIAALFFAFHHTPDVSVIIAGYTIAVLFTVVSVTSGGIGVVEPTMSLALASLGVPLAQATVITLAFRNLNLWVPIVVGAVMLQRVRSFVRE